ncbi:ribonuclease H1 small subunit [Coniochaeta ligniaria NRRL 30616]|uniref:Ribonuclease H1 small subunit n=1 Tax=Coniochaeta ligniaria NRRL 30616 TaxID=1408157 RepID=A0A1J7JWX1_9PEZI|nr:ribonuclease H1 small subunit [Coniochaeta ligniaria NRRL 30616]
MTQPMLSIKSDKPSNSKTTAHLLPCRVHYDGPVEPAQSYWSPTQQEDGPRIAYFRGRKLHGKTVKLPEGYRGVVVEKQAAPPAAAQPEQDAADLQQEDAEDQVPLGSLETKADFDELVVWGHEAMADAASDPYMRIGEWTRLAEQIHSYSAVEHDS